MDLTTELFENAVYAILDEQCAAGNVDCRVKRVRKLLEKRLKLPKKSLKDFDPAISDLMELYKARRRNESSSCSTSVASDVDEGGGDASPVTPDKPVATVPSTPAEPSGTPSRQEKKKKRPRNATDLLAISDVYEIRKRVIILLREADLNNLTTREVLEHIQTSFGYSAEEVAIHKPLVKTIIEDYRNSHALSEHPKTYKFSKKEDEIIINAMNQYKEAYGVTDVDLNPTLRESGERVRKNWILWREISDLLPHRNPQLIYARAQRILNAKHQSVGKWSEEDVGTVLKLVSQKVPFSKIGRLLGRNREDCRGVYLRSKTRASTGAFSLEEDQQIYNAVKRVTNFTDDLSLPIDDIAWKDVAKRLKNGRHPEDYCRRWRIIRQKRMDTALGTPPIDEHERRMKKESAILDYILNCGAEDKSEITWTNIDRLHDWRLGEASRLWSLMCKGLPLGCSFTRSVEILTQKRDQDAVRDFPSQKNHGLESVTPKTSRKRRLALMGTPGGDIEEELEEAAGATIKKQRRPGRFQTVQNGDDLELNNAVKQEPSSDSSGGLTTPIAPRPSNRRVTGDSSSSAKTTMTSIIEL